MYFQLEYKGIYLNRTICPANASFISSQLSPINHVNSSLINNYDDRYITSRKEWKVKLMKAIRSKTQWILPGSVIYEHNNSHKWIPCIQTYYSKTVRKRSIIFFSFFFIFLNLVTISVYHLTSLLIPYSPFQLNTNTLKLWWVEEQFRRIVMLQFSKNFNTNLT